MADIVMGLNITVAQFIRHRERIDDAVVPQLVDEQLMDELTSILDAENHYQVCRKVGQ
jgi:hypothetical protein